MTPPRKRLEMRVTLSRGVLLKVDGSRNPIEGDKRALAELMFAAYQGTVDYSGESIEDAEREVTATMNGSYGTYLPACSYVVERDSKLICASLITVLKHEPLLAFAMTSPSFKRQGLARAIISNSMQALLHIGQSNLNLVVNPKNSFAIALYDSLGFKAKSGDA